MLPIQLVHHPEFYIEMESEDIELRGSVDESAGIMLKGSVVLNLNEVTKVKSITLNFTGKSRVAWTEGVGSHQKLYKDEKIIIQHEWCFLPCKAKSYHLTQGHFKWDFELPLPGDIPSSIQHELGDITYGLKATVERPKFSMNYTSKKSVNIHRVLVPSSLEYTQSLLISNTWVDKLSYDISAPSRVFTPGSLIPITFSLHPIAQELRVKSASCTLQEFITLSTSDHTITEGKDINSIKDENFSTGPDRWIKTEMLSIPDIQSQLLHKDTHSDLLEVKHKLAFSVSLINADGHLSELRASIQVVISDVASAESENALPTYEDAWKSAPYNPQELSDLIQQGHLPPSLALTAPNYAAHTADHMLSSDTEDESDSSTPTQENFPLPWEGIDLSRVPSYTTAIRSNRLYSFSGSLPGYDSISIPGVIR